MKLYYAPGACSLSPHIVAKEADLQLTLEKVDLKEHKTESGADYYSINPKGYVPALVLDDGNILTEGPAIVQFLADQKPDSELLGAVGSFSRYKTVEWLTFINSEIHKSFGPLFGKPTDDEKAAAISKIKKRFDYVEGQLKGESLLDGATFTAADAYMFVMLRWADKMGISIPNNLANFYRHVGTRPAVVAAMREEGLA